MQTQYIRFCKQYDDPVWGMQAVTWVHTPMVRVTRNRLRKACFEWVANPRMKFDLESVRRGYPIAVYAAVKRHTGRKL